MDSSFPLPYREIDSVASDAPISLKADHLWSLLTALGSDLHPEIDTNGPTFIGGGGPSFWGAFFDLEALEFRLLDSMGLKLAGGMGATLSFGRWEINGE